MNRAMLLMIETNASYSEKSMYLMSTRMNLLKRRQALLKLNMKSNDWNNKALLEKP